MRHSNKYVINNYRMGTRTHLMDDGRIVAEQQLKGLAEATKAQKAAGGIPLGSSHAQHVGNIPTNTYYKMLRESGGDPDLFHKKIMDFLKNRDHRDFLVRDKV